MRNLYFIACGCSFSFAVYFWCKKNCGLIVPLDPKIINDNLIRMMCLSLCWRLTLQTKLTSTLNLMKLNNLFICAGCEIPDVIVVDDDEPEIVATSGVQYCDPVLNSRGPGTLVIRRPVAPTKSNVCAPIITSSSITSVAAPRMFLTLPSGASNRPLFLPAGFTHLQIISPAGSSVSYSFIYLFIICFITAS